MELVLIRVSIRLQGLGLLLTRVARILELELFFNLLADSLS